jgi:hypothetical protein
LVAKGCFDSTGGYRTYFSVISEEKLDSLIAFTMKPLSSTILGKSFPKILK